MRISERFPEQSELKVVWLPALHFLYSLDLIFVCQKGKVYASKVEAGALFVRISNALIEA